RPRQRLHPGQTPGRAAMAPATLVDGTRSGGWIPDYFDLQPDLSDAGVQAERAPSRLAPVSASADSDLPLCRTGCSARGLPRPTASSGSPAEGCSCAVSCYARSADWQSPGPVSVVSAAQPAVVAREVVSEEFGEVPGAQVVGLFGEEVPGRDGSAAHLAGPG